MGKSKSSKPETYPTKSKRSVVTEGHVEELMEVKKKKKKIEVDVSITVTCVCRFLGGLGCFVLFFFKMTRNGALRNT